MGNDLAKASEALDGKKIPLEDGLPAGEVTPEAKLPAVGSFKATTGRNPRANFKSEATRASTSVT